MTTAALNTALGVERYLSEFAARERQLSAVGPGWLHAMRRSALARFGELGFPTTRVEEFKYTNLAPLARTAFETAPAASAADLSGLGRRDLVSGLAAHRVLVVNGRPSGSLPNFPGVEWSTLEEALRERPGLMHEHLARLAAFDRHALVALNTAFLENGVVLRIGDGVVVERPLVVVHYSVGDARPWVTYPRTLVLAGRNSQAVVMEAWIGPDNAVYFTNAVTEIFVAEGAVLDYTRLELEGDQAFHFEAVHARQGRSSNLTVNSIALGGALVRSEVGAVLAGEGASCVLNGLYLAGGRQHIDNYTTLDHAQPHTTSLELYKGILDGHGEGVFHGRIIVRPEAQKTDAIQRNRNLLLSDDAVVNTKPQLEIYADDVRCTHGATVGQVDADAVFYLRSRGVGEHEARRLLTLAFAGEIVERLKPAALQQRLNELMAARLSDALTRNP